MWRIRDYDEIGSPEEVDLRANIRRRLVPVREQYRGDVLCRVLRDPRTDQYYLEPTVERTQKVTVTKSHRPILAPSTESDQRRQKRPRQPLYLEPLD